MSKTDPQVENVQKAADTAHKLAQQAGLYGKLALDLIQQLGLLVGKSILVCLPILNTIINILRWIVPLLIVGYGAYKAYLIAITFYKEAKANEWMLIIRDGKLQSCGVGLSTWSLPGDQVVTFPSTINQITYRAQQVTTEMQGIEVSGMLVWSVHREGDSPYKCYRNFGSTLNNGCNEINEKLESLSVAIIRDKIANLNIDTILKNRNQLRDSIRKEIQKLISGWGIWLETIEIADVKIASGTLFKNLQTEFREEQNLKASKIKAESDDLIRQQDLKRNTDFEKTQKEKQSELDKRKMELEADKELFEMQTKVKNQTEIQKLDQALFQTQLQEQDISLEIQKIKNEQILRKMKKELELKEKYYKGNYMKAMILQKTEQIYGELRVHEMKIINIADNGDSKKDSAGQLISQLMSQYHAVQEGMR